MKKKPSKSGGLKGFIRDLVYAAVAVLIINSFVLAVFEVPTGSMEDTVKIGDRLFVNKFIYGGTTPYTIPFTSIRIPHFRVPGFRSVRQGDVIVFDWPGRRDDVSKPPQVWYLKRCIALPGDKVRIDQKVVYVNDKPMQNPEHMKFRDSAPLPAPIANNEWDSRMFPRGSRFNKDNYGPIIVPKKGMILDLTPESYASWEVFIQREGHTIELRGDKIVIDGRETSSYVVGRDYIFAMGDNRDNSEDSRFWGFVPIEDIIGKPMFVFWSWDPQIHIYDIFSKIGSINLRRIGTIIR
jgi:signal peptidase I